ncbi:MAG: orotidine-5'-phosphate decarboxylase [Ignavibacteria bacterium]|nr:orotidine-5'-phosphate decarboxylase [Ignavibacteria bacterium]
MMSLKSGLCISLDPDIRRIPAHLMRGEQPIISFLTQVIHSTRRFASAYKINTAFFEQYGRSGIEAMYRIREELGESYCIVDAKRGDIGNSSDAYARAIFDDLKADAATVSPYMGRDSAEAFLKYENKLVYVLALTSNPGASDFQFLNVNGQPLYSVVIERAMNWDRSADLGFVFGANRLEQIADFRIAHPNVPLLLPGIGAQGATLESAKTANANGPAFFSVGREILYSSDGEDFAEQAARAASRFLL